jgi:short-subunit dehydrogenase
MKQYTENKLALITGASSGIGFELAKIFAKNGYDLLIVSHTEKIEDKAEELKGFGVQVESIESDLASREGAKNVYQKVQSLGRPVDVLAVNAGVGVSGTAWEVPIEEQLNLIDLNVRSLVELTSYVLKDMVEANSGKILMTSSIAAEMPGPYYAVYAASKAFIQSYCEAIRFEVKESKLDIAVTSLQPGPTDTEFFKTAGMEDTKAGQGKKDDPALVAQDGFDALMANKDHVVAGSFKNKVQTVVGKFISEEAGAKAHAESTRTKKP